MAHGPKFITIVCRGLSGRTRVRDNQGLSCRPALGFCQLSPLVRSSWGCASANGLAATCPIQSELHRYILIRTSTNQEEHFPNNQSECTISSNQDSAVWTSQTANLDSLFPWKWTSQGPRLTLDLSRAPVCSEGCTFRVLQRLCLHGLQTVHLNKVSPSPHPILGTPVGTGLVAVNFCWQFLL